MTESSKFELLRELARLFIKFGPTTFSELSAFLKDPVGIGELTDILEATDLAGREIRPRKVEQGRKPKGKGIEGFLTDIRITEPEKAELLFEFYQALVAKRLLSTLRELKSFASDNGLQSVRATSRDKAVSPLLRELATHNTDKIRSLMDRAKSREMRSDRTLEGWTGIILNKDRGKQ